MTRGEEPICIDLRQKWASRPALVPNDQDILVVLLSFENKVATTYLVPNNQEVEMGNKEESPGVYIHFSVCYIIGSHTELAK